MFLSKKALSTEEEMQKRREANALLEERFENDTPAEKILPDLEDSQ